MLDEVVETFGSYVEGRGKAYADLLNAIESERTDKAPSRGAGKSKGPSAQQRRQKRERKQQHIADMAHVFATGDWPDTAARAKQKRTRPLRDLAR